MHRELCYQRIQHHFSFGQIGGCRLNEDVFRIQCDFRMITIDDWWQRHDHTIGIVYNGIDRCITDNRQILLQLSVCLMTEIKLLALALMSFHIHNTHSPNKSP